MENVRAACSPSYNRKAAQIDKVYFSYEDGNHQVHSEDRFRLNTIQRLDGSIVLEVGLTSHEELLATNFAAQQTIASYFAYGAQSYASKHACMSDAIGVGTFLVSADDFVLLFKRQISPKSNVGRRKYVQEFLVGEPKPLVQKA